MERSRMKVTIKNLGAVREAEIELKPLTVFVGPNNTGKTWTAYIVSAIFGFLRLVRIYANGLLARETNHFLIRPLEKCQ